MLDADSCADALDGLFAYDSGATDSGIRDEVLRQQVQEHLSALAPEARKRFLDGVACDLFLSTEAAQHGYGEQDATAFLAWAAELSMSATTRKN